MDDKICAICQDDDEIINTHRYCKCSFYYHPKCINKWINHNHDKRCNICKKKYIKIVKSSKYKKKQNRKDTIPSDSKPKWYTKFLCCTKNN